MRSKSIMSVVMPALWVATSVALLSSCDNLFGPDGGGGGGGQDDPTPAALFTLDGEDYHTPFEINGQAFDTLQAAIDEAAKLADTDQETTITLPGGVLRPKDPQPLKVELNHQGDDPEVTIEGVWDDENDVPATTVAAPIKITGSGSITARNITVDHSEFDAAIDELYGIWLTKDVDLSGWNDETESLVLKGFGGGFLTALAALRIESITLDDEQKPSPYVKGVSFQKNQAHVWSEDEPKDVEDALDALQEQNHFDGFVQSPSSKQVIWKSIPE